MILQNLFYKGKGKSPVRIVKTILGEAYRDAGLLEPTNNEVLKVLKNMKETDKSIVLAM
jgi:hypothetical protein